MIEGIDPHQTGARILDIECDENRTNIKPRMQPNWT